MNWIAQKFDALVAKFDALVATVETALTSHSALAARVEVLEKLLAEPPAAPAEIQPAAGG